MFTRRAMAGVGAAAAVAATSGASAAPAPSGALMALKARLATLKPKRDYASVPQILTEASDFDGEAIRTVIAYPAGPKQVWDVKDIGGGWPGYVRNALNGQVFAFKHDDFLVVSLHRSQAVLALIDQPTWDKYQIARLLDGKITANGFIAAQSKPPFQTLAHSGESFSPQDTSIATLMQRGVVFMACHNAIFVMAGLAMANANPQKLTQEQVAAEFTNHLLPGVILTPGAFATLPELQQAGFGYLT